MTQDAALTDRPSLAFKDGSPAMSSWADGDEGTTLFVKPWLDPIVDSLGFDPRSSYVEHFWLPILGPSCIFLLRRMAWSFDLEEGTQEMSLGDMSYEIGLGSPKGFGNSITRTLNRSIQFGMAKLMPNGVLAIRRSMPPLNQRQLARLPEDLRELHNTLTNGPSEATGNAVQRRSVQLALSLIDYQANESVAQEAFARWHVDESVAAAAMDAIWPLA